MATQTCELWLIVDAAGDYAVASSEDDATERYVETIGPLESSSGFRCVKLSLTVPLPACIEAEGEIPEDGGEVELTVS